MLANRRPVPSSTSKADSLRADTNTKFVVGSTTTSTGRLPRVVGRLKIVGCAGSVIQSTPEPSATEVRPLLGFTSRPAGRPPIVVEPAVWGVGSGVGDGTAVGATVAAGVAGAAGAGWGRVTAGAGAGGGGAASGSAVGTLGLGSSAGIV